MSEDRRATRTDIGAPRPLGPLLGGPTPLLAMMRAGVGRRWRHNRRGWRGWLPVGVAVAVASLTGSAHAEERAPGDLGKLKRAFFDAEIAYWQGTIGDPRSTTQALVQTENVGVFGYRRVPFSLGMAFAPNEQWLVGGRIDLAFEPDRDPGDAPLTIRGAIGPFAQLFFLRDRHVRPFAMVRANIGRSHAFARNQGESVLDETDVVTFYPTVGVGLGSHVFLSDQVSFDAMLMLDYRWNFARGPAPTIEVEGLEGDSATVRPEGWQLRNGTLATALTFGFSHWF